MQNLSIKELEEEYDQWNKIANSGNNSNVTSFAHHMRKAAEEWIRIRKDETRRLRKKSQGGASGGW